MLAVGLPVAVAVGGGRRLRAGAPRARCRSSASRTRPKRSRQHNLSERLPVVRSGDELERLSVSLNHMISRLEDAIAQLQAVRRRCLARAAHAAHGDARRTREPRAGRARFERETRETLGSVLEEVERLAKIVESLFALSRLDAGRGARPSGCASTWRSSPPRPPSR